MIEIKDLSFSYGKRQILHHIDFQAKSGQIVAVLGPNGAGKSTLFRCVLGLLKQYTGSVLFDGKEVRSLTRHELAKQAAYIPQSVSPVYNYNVLDMVLMGATGTSSPLQRPGAKEQELARRSLIQMGIEELEHRGINQISGGERQLVMIARALAQQAQLLIMDEPTANLDYGNQYRVMKQIQELAKQGYTILLSTHNPEHALRFSTDVLALQRDGSVFIGKTEDVLTAERISALYGLPVVVTEVKLPEGTVRNCTPV